MNLIGLLITKDDEEVLATWFDEQLSLYDAVVCLDGSASDRTERLAAAYAPRLVYLHERDFHIPYKTDHGLRRVVHEEIVRRYGVSNWVMCCHADEFCYHDPRKIAALAEREGYDLVSWFSPHFYPHPSELSDWPTRRLRPVPERHRWYHWSYRNDGFPWIEDRLYHNGSHVQWDIQTHGSVQPKGLRSPAPFHPIFRHYKVIAADTADFDVGERASHYRHHWQGLEHRTGLAFPVRRFEDFFVSAIPNYTRCDRFAGEFAQPWNMGEEFQPDGLASGSSAQPTTVLSSQSRAPYVPFIPGHVDQIRLLDDLSETFGIERFHLEAMWRSYRTFSEQRGYAAALGERKTLCTEEAFVLAVLMERHRPRRVAQIGVEDGKTTRRLIDLAKWLGLGSEFIAFDSVNHVRWFESREASLRIGDVTGSFRRLVLDAVEPQLIFVDAHRYGLLKEIVQESLSHASKPTLAIHDCGRGLCNPAMMISWDNPAVTSLTGVWERHVLAECFDIDDPLNAQLDDAHHRDRRLRILDTPHGLGILWRE